MQSAEWALRGVDICMIDCVVFVGEVEIEIENRACWYVQPGLRFVGFSLGSRCFGQFAIRQSCVEQLLFNLYAYIDRSLSMNNQGWGYSLGKDSSSIQSLAQQNRNFC